jgi:Ran-binding protein 3
LPRLSDPSPQANEPASQGNRSQSPVKKSRALSTSAEADENDNEDGDDFVDALDGEVPNPSPRPSPPQETKVRQLSQDTDDINACNDQQASQDRGDGAAPPAVPDNAAPLDAQTETGTSSPISADIESQSQLDIVEVSATGEVDAKVQTGETNALASVEPAVLSPITEEANVPVAASATHISQPEAQRPLEIENQNQQNSHTDTGAGSNARETKRPTPPLSEVDGATKRPREDEDGDLDPNPRETKRASPPPEKEKEKEKEKKEKPMRKKSGSDARAPSAPASPRSKPAAVFVRRPLSPLLRLVFAN